MHPPPGLTREKDLLLRIANNDEKAFSVLFERYYYKVTRYIICTTGMSTDDLYDIVQEVFIAVWEKRYVLPAVRFFESYLYILAKNTLLNSERHRKIRARVLSDYSRRQRTLYNNTESNAIYKCLHTVVFNTIHTLPGKCGEVFRLHILHGLSQRQIAEQLNVSTQVVGKHITRGKDRVIRQLVLHGNWQATLVIIGTGILLNLKVFLLKICMADGMDISAWFFQLG